jgi:hypothetical protein
LSVSDTAHAVLLTLIAGNGHWILGSIDYHLLALTARRLSAGHRHR